MGLLRVLQAKGFGGLVIGEKFTIAAPVHHALQGPVLSAWASGPALAHAPDAGIAARLTQGSSMLVCDDKQSEKACFKTNMEIIIDAVEDIEGT